MTPAQLRQSAQAESERLGDVYRTNLNVAWHGAYLQRVDAKAFPSLEKMLTPPEKVPPKRQGVDEDALLVAIQLHNERVKQKNG